MNVSNKLLSDIVSFRSYAKYLPHLQRREIYEETVNRCMNQQLEKFPKLSRDIVTAFKKVHEYKLMPALRTFQFAGDAINKNCVRSYNCSYTPIDDVRVFGEILYILLSGAGVGFSVQKHHINQLPVIKKPKEENYFGIHDSIEGWAQALDLLMDSYFYNRIRPIFDYSLIRSKDSRLSTTGAKAPGPEPLKYTLGLVEEKLKNAIGRKLKSIEVHDIICIISECVLAGGIRRSSLISLFDLDDEDMLKCKTGSWWEATPWRARANNSVYLVRSQTTKEQFDYIYKITKESGSGEPGFFWSNDENKNLGGNPCAEISLNPNQFCNLTSVNQTGVSTEKELLSRVYSATLIGTLQASYTNFPYLRDKWRLQTEKEALLGVSFTGIADTNGYIPSEWLQSAAQYAKEINEKYAKKIGINLAARIGTIKPEGSCSAVLGSSSGLHARHAPYYLRRVRMNKNDSLATYLLYSIPELMEEDVTSANTVILTIPQESPKDAIVRTNETAESLFNRSCFYFNNWIIPSHREGLNYHNVSCTVSVKDDEWDSLRELLWQHKNEYSGISLLPYSDHTYKQAPFEECDKETFEKYNGYIKNVDLKEVKEEQDNTVRQELIACGGNNGSCEIT